MSKRVYDKSCFPLPAVYIFVIRICSLSSEVCEKSLLGIAELIEQFPRSFFLLLFGSCRIVIVILENVKRGFDELCFLTINATCRLQSHVKSQFLNFFIAKVILASVLSANKKHDSSLIRSHDSDVFRKREYIGTSRWGSSYYSLTATRRKAILRAA